MSNYIICKIDLDFFETKLQEAKTMLQYYDMAEEEVPAIVSAATSYLMEAVIKHLKENKIK